MSATRCSIFQPFEDEVETYSFGMENKWWKKEFDSDKRKISVSSQAAIKIHSNQLSQT